MIDSPFVYRYGGTLQVQDLNVVLRHYGNLKRWKDVSQVL